MANIQSLRHQVITAIAELPPEALMEIISFVEFLRYKSGYERGANQPFSNVSTISNVNSSNVQSPPLYERLLPDQLAQAFLEWAESHRDLDLPMLSDQAIGRESIYGEGW